MKKKFKAIAVPCQLCLLKTYAGRRERRFSSLMALVQGQGEVTKDVEECHRLVLCLQCNALLESALVMVRLISEMQIKIRDKVREFRTIICDSEPLFVETGEVSKLRKRFVELAENLVKEVVPSPPQPKASSKMLVKAKLKPKSKLKKKVMAQLTKEGEADDVRDIGDDDDGVRVRRRSPSALILEPKLQSNDQQSKLSEAEIKEEASDSESNFPNLQKRKIVDDSQEMVQTEVKIEKGDEVDMKKGDDRLCSPSEPNYSREVEDSAVKNEVIEISDDEIEIFEPAVTEMTKLVNMNPRHSRRKQQLSVKLEPDDDEHGRLSPSAFILEPEPQPNDDEARESEVKAKILDDNSNSDSETNFSRSKKRKIGDDVQERECRQRTENEEEIENDGAGHCSYLNTERQAEGFQVKHEVIEISDDEIEIIEPQVSQMEKLVPGILRHSKRKQQLSAQVLEPEIHKNVEQNLPRLTSSDTQVTTAPKNCAQTGQVVSNSSETKIKLFFCIVCERTFPTAKGLLAHRVATHEREEKPFSCPKCDMKLSTKGNLTRHLVLNSCRENLSCASCRLGFWSRASLDNHNLKKHAYDHLKPISCNFCPKKVNTESGLVLHLTRVHSDKKPFKCDYCSEYFANFRLRASHMESSHEEGTKCGHCGAKVATTKLLIQHMNRHNLRGCYGVKCGECGEKFKYKRTLESHQVRMHGRDPFVCDICGAKFTGKLGLTGHIKVVHEIKIRKYKCDICGAAFKTEKVLKNHVKSHANERPYVCSYCGAAYTTDQGLKLHEQRVHSEEGYKHKYKHSCPTCDKPFEHKSGMEAHIRAVHTGERPFVCEQANCDKKFSTKGSLTQHLKLAHGIMPVLNPNRLPHVRRKKPPKVPKVKKRTLKKNKKKVKPVVVEEDSEDLDSDQKTN